MHATKHSWMTLRINRPSFVGSYLQVMVVDFRPMKKKNNLHGSHILSVFFRISNQALLSQMKHLKN